MAVIDKNSLKTWFSRGNKPLASQFAAWIDAYWHKDEAIPISSVDGLAEILASKADSEVVANIIAGSKNVIELQEEDFVLQPDGSYTCSKAHTLESDELVSVLYEAGKVINSTNYEIEFTTNLFTISNISFNTATKIKLTI